MKKATGDKIDCKVRRDYGFHSDHAICIDINGGMTAGGVTVRVAVPPGHCADEVAVEMSRGAGWFEIESYPSNTDRR